MLARMVVDHVPRNGSRRFTTDEYQRMGEVGIFSHDERLELIDGEVLKMPSIKSPHAAAVDRANQTLMLALGSAAIVRVQSPMSKALRVGGGRR